MSAFIVPVKPTAMFATQPLYVFNPAHDEALSANYPYYYPSTIARRLAVEWATLPAVWAEHPAYVWLPGEVEVPLQGAWCEGVHFVTAREMNGRFWQTVSRIEPWGWDLLVRHQLRKAGAPADLLPSDEQIVELRRLSSRETTTRLLPWLLQHPALQPFPLVGQSLLATSSYEVESTLAEWGGAVIKSLWSCSGRGIFRVARHPTASDSGRIGRLLREQGAVEIEPIWDKVMDFALEFDISASRGVTYQGASLFETNTSGGYTGNWLAPQSVILGQISAVWGRADWLSPLIGALSEGLHLLLGGKYEGIIGVDMMLCRQGQALRLLPCVEVNLRHTMGYVALVMSARSIGLEQLPPSLQKLWYVPS